jgi:ribosome-associated protein
MLEINDQIRIPDDELEWSYVRSGGPGGQNVNKVASKAVLRWNLAASPSLPEKVKTRLRTLQRRRITTEGELVLSSQRYRDQGRNVEDCLAKLREMILQATVVPKARKATRPSRGAREARLKEKRHRSSTKTRRRRPVEE